MTGIGSLLDLGGTGHVSLLNSLLSTLSHPPSKGRRGFEADVQNLRSDFDAAIKSVRQAEPRIPIKD